MLTVRGVAADPDPPRRQAACHVPDRWRMRRRRRSWRARTWWRSSCSISCSASPTWRTRPTPKTSVCSVRACVRACVRALGCARALVRVRVCVCSPRVCVPVLPCSRRVRSVRHVDPIRHCNAHVFRMPGIARVAAGPTLRVSLRAVLSAHAPLPPRDRMALRPTLTENRRVDGMGQGGIATQGSC